MEFEGPHHPRFKKLIDFLARVPAVETNDSRFGGFGTGLDGDTWWVKFSIDVAHPLAWHAVQELGHVLNYLSLNERLPTRFYPVSPPPYLNGGPEFLSWVIDCSMDAMRPGTVAEWLEGRLPKPVEDTAMWTQHEDPPEADDDEG